MKLLRYILPVILLAAGCSKDQLALRPCTFEVSVSDIKATKATLSIRPSNKDAWYYYFLASSDDDNFNESDEKLIQEDLDFTHILIEELGDIFHIGTFMQAFCYKGDRDLPVTLLTSGADHKVFVYQIDPKTEQKMSGHVRFDFHTREVKQSDVTFDIKFSGSTVTITPSDPEAVYFWEYENSDYILNDYFSPRLYLYRIMDMYVNYGFFDSVTSKGTDTWDFDTMDDEMEEGEICSLVIAGVDPDGEFTTSVTCIDFEYHKGKVAPITVDDYNYDFPLPRQGFSLPKSHKFRIFAEWTKRNSLSGTE